MIFDQLIGSNNFNNNMLEIMNVGNHNDCLIFTCPCDLFYVRNRHEVAMFAVKLLFFEGAC